MVYLRKSRTAQQMLMQWLLAAARTSPGSSSDISQHFQKHMTAWRVVMVITFAVGSDSTLKKDIRMIILEMVDFYDCMCYDNGYMFMGKYR